MERVWRRSVVVEGKPAAKEEPEGARKSRGTGWMKNPGGEQLFLCSSPDDRQFHPELQFELHNSKNHLLLHKMKGVLYFYAAF